MDELGQLCRICARSKSEESQNLFQQKDSKLLRLILQLTGITIKNTKYLPQCICRECLQNLRRAKEFHVRFIKAQYFFMTRVNLGNRKKKVIINGSVTEKSLNTFKEVEREKINKSFVEIQEVGYGLREEIPPLNKGTGSKNCELKHLNDEKANATEKNKSIAVAETGNADLQMYKFEEVIANRTEITPNIDQLPEQDDHVVIDGRKLRNITEYMCDYCGNSYDNSNHFRTHLNRHRGIKPFHCKLCPSKFFTKSECKRHEFKHKGIRNLRCRYCDRYFLYYNERIKHERNHNNERPFICNYCGKKFTTSTWLKDHIISHTGERNFHCTLCGKSFQLRKHLLAHYRSQFHKHNQEKQELQKGVD